VFRFKFLVQVQGMGSGSSSWFRFKVYSSGLRSGLRFKRSKFRFKRSRFRFKVWVLVFISIGLD